ncbi:hydrogenase nickel incorporation protein HypB [Azotosporobacter soli]|uniref:hydrogenase nickel incorporation protein HypB n=1 Tax=Azotosporobacter soli TaxID=3055040 RepID=UPI0031FED734
MQIRVMEDLLEHNEAMSKAVKERLDDYGILVLNLMGSPGCGKTSLLEQTVEALGQELRFAVVEGDLYTAQDAERIARHGIPTVQINTAGGCHLNAGMIEAVLGDLPLAKLDILVIENVGNLVCPAEFDIGEDAKVVLLSVTEGEDKPLKYPLAFRRAAVAILNKTDLLPHLNFDKTKAVRDIKGINPLAPIIEVSCQTGDGLTAWYEWLREQVRRKQVRSKGGNGEVGRNEDRD